MFCFTCSFGQEKFIIKGNVKSLLNVDLVDIGISFISKKKETQVITDSLGMFSLQLESGLVNVSINDLGFIENNFQFNLKRDTIINILLKRGELQLNEVVVSNTKKNLITNLSGGKLVFDMKALSSMPNLFGNTDVIKLLQLTPGVQNSGDANGYIYVRGSDPGHNSILYGEIPIYGMSHLLGFFPFYNPDHIKDVEFDKSSNNAKYGGRLSSTITINTKSVVPNQFMVEGNIGLLASQVTFSIPLTKKTGFYFSTRKTYIDEVISPILNPGSNNRDLDGMKYGFADNNLTFISKISKNHQLKFDAFISSDKLNIKDSNLALNTVLKWSNFSFSPVLISKLSSRTIMSNSLYFTKYTNYFNLRQSSLEAEVSSFVNDFGFKNSINFFVDKTPIQLGFQYVNHSVQPQSIQIEEFIPSSRVTQNGVVKTNELTFYGTIKPKLFDNVFAELGLRLDNYNLLFYFQPRILVNYNLNSKSSFYISYAKQNQYLHLITNSSVGIPTDFWIASFDIIRPQESEEFSIGSNHHISRNILFSLGGFYRSMKNLLEYPYGVTQFNEMSTLSNDLIIGRGKAYGLEMLLNKTYGKFKGWLSYTLSWSDRDFNELNNGNTFFAKYDRRHNLSLIGTYELNSKWDIGITQIITSGNRFTTPTSWYFINNNPVKEYSGYNNAQMPNYIRTDISFNYFFTKNLKKENAINFSIYNSFNIENPVYVVLNVEVNKENQSIVVAPEKKIMYRMLPSISWKFKF